MNQYFNLVQKQNQDLVTTFSSIISECLKNNSIKNMHNLINEVKIYTKKNISDTILLDTIIFDSSMSSNEELVVNLNPEFSTYNINLKYYINFDSKIVLFDYISFFNKDSLLSFGFSKEYNNLTIYEPFSSDNFGIMIKSSGENLSFLSNEVVTNTLPKEISHIGFFKICNVLSKNQPSILLKYLYDNSSLQQEEYDLCKLVYDIDLSSKIFSINLEKKLFNNKYEIIKKKNSFIDSIKSAIF